MKCGDIGFLKTYAVIHNELFNEVVDHMKARWNISYSYGIYKDQGTLTYDECILLVNYYIAEERRKHEKI